MSENQNQIVNDPWESGENPQISLPDYWGLCSIDMWYCVLEKGVGKVRFDPNIHKLDQRRTAIEIVITPLPEMNSSREASRSLVAESKEWAGIVLPSIKALGISTRELNGKYARISYKETGKTYVKTADDGTQETRNSTTIVFVKIFPDEAACCADWVAAGGAPGAAIENAAIPPLTDAPAPAAANATNGNGNGNGNGNDQAKAAALAFLRVLVNNVTGNGEKDLNKIRENLATKIAGMPPIAKYFTVDSPETMQLLAEKIPF